MALSDLVNSWKSERKKLGNKTVIDGSTDIREAVKPFIPCKVHPLYDHAKYVELFVEKPKSAVVTSHDKSDTFHAWFIAFISKNPKYQYLHKTKSSFSSNKWFYWFLDTSRNVTVILSKSQISETIQI